MWNGATEFTKKLSMSNIQLVGQKGQYYLAYIPTFHHIFLCPLSDNTCYKSITNRMESDCKFKSIGKRFQVQARVEGKKWICGIMKHYELKEFMTTHGSCLGWIRRMSALCAHITRLVPCSHHHLISVCISTSHFTTVGWYAMTSIYKAN